MTRAEKRQAKIRARDRRTTNFEGQERRHVAFQLACVAHWRASAQASPGGSMSRMYAVARIKQLIKPLRLLRIGWKAFR